MKQKLLGKKGEGSMWYVVGAALALAVLAVSLMLFFGQMGRISGKYKEISEPTHTSAEKTGWCLSTITEGKQCGYELSCAEIGERLGGSGKVAVSAEDKQQCKGTGKIRTYSETQQQFCCVTIS